MHEDAGLDSFMESHLNGGAEFVDVRRDSREAYPCPICRDVACDGHCDHGPEQDGNDVSEFDGEPTFEDGEPRGSHDLSDDGDALASAGHGTDEDYGGGSHIEDSWDF